jgi:hypothetical protein
MPQEPPYCPLEERARRRLLDFCAANAAEKRDRPGHAVSLNQLLLSNG